MKQDVEMFAGSFDDLTQGDIVDYYTMVSPSGEYPGSQTLQRKGSPGVWVPPGIDHALVSYALFVIQQYFYENLQYCPTRALEFVFN